MQGMPLRILLIFTMTAWSPAWCCCAVRAVALHGANTDGAQVRACCTIKVQVQAARTCCTRTVQATSRPCSDECPPCRCADQEIKQHRLNTAAQVAAPSPTVNHLVCLPPDAASPHFSSEVSIGAPLGAARSHAPPCTLLGLGCLLLV
ncbi:MAG TPA: hypothetical protein PK400_05585 [Phycisphaerales bacterium]|nr:hypothetical protein [Phycisphaerales bacterium]HRQ75972.1 hypothetical protein [Phycisphaerales bacterium]